MLVFAMQILQIVFMTFWMDNVLWITWETRFLCKMCFLEKLDWRSSL